MADAFESMEEFRRQAKYPLMKVCDMPIDLREEVQDVCITLVEKHSSDYEKCTQTIKETLDKKLGGPWHVVAGTNFSYDVTHKSKSLQFLFVGPSMGVLAWKV